MVHSQLQSAHGPSHLHATWQTQIFALEPRPTKPSTDSRKPSAGPPSFAIRILKCLLRSKWTPLLPVLGLCCLNTTVSLPASILALFSTKTDPAEQNYDIGKPGTAGYQVSLRRVASLAGGSIIPIHSNY